MEILSYKYFAITSLILWFIAVGLFFFKNKFQNSFLKSLPIVFTILGIVVMSIFTTLLWIDLDRPPMRTLGETRLWYSLFLPLIGIFIYAKWKYNWFIIKSCH
jgi:hypothetical protein